MNMLRLAFELFVIYLLYKLVFEFIIPVYNTTRKMKEKVTEMHQKMQEKAENESQHPDNVRRTEQSKKSFSDDYIDYEEIR